MFIIFQDEPNSYQAILITEERHKKGESRTRPGFQILVRRVIFQFVSRENLMCVYLKESKSKDLTNVFLKSVPK